MQREEASTLPLESICLHPLTATAACADQKTMARQPVWLQPLPMEARAPRPRPRFELQNATT